MRGNLFLLNKRNPSKLPLRFHLLAMISISRRLIGTLFDSDERDKARENVTLVKEALNSKLGSILEIKRLPIPFPAEPKKATASSVLRLPNIKR